MTSGDVAAEGRALSLLGIKCWWDGAYANALAHFDAALEAASSARDRFVEWEARRYAGVTMIVTGRVEEGFAAQLEVLESVRATRGAELLVPHVQMYLGHSRRHVGDVDAAVVNLEAARDAYERTTNTASLIHVYGALAELATDRGDLDVGLRMAGRGLELSTIGGMRTYEPWLLCTVARVHAGTGDHDSARYSAASAIASQAQGWSGETHRVARGAGGGGVAARRCVVGGATDRTRRCDRRPAGPAARRAGRTGPRGSRADGGGEQCPVDRGGRSRRRVRRWPRRLRASSARSSVRPRASDVAFARPLLANPYRALGGVTAALGRSRVARSAGGDLATT